MGLRRNFRSCVYQYRRKVYRQCLHLALHSKLHTNAHRSLRGKADESLSLLVADRHAFSFSLFHSKAQVLVSPGLLSFKDPHNSHDIEAFGKSSSFLAVSHLWNLILLKSKFSSFRKLFRHYSCFSPFSSLYQSITV